MASPKVPNLSELDIAVVGVSGVGKSALINSLVGCEIVKEGDRLTGETQEVTPYRETINGIEVTLWDTPGLQGVMDLDTETVIQMITESCKKVDLLIYCSQMTDRRVNSDTIKSISAITSVFGQQVWENAVYTLTCANEIRPPHGSNDTKEVFFTRTLTERRKHVCKAMREIPQKILKQLPIIPTGYRECALPDHPDWRTEFWMACYYKTKNEAKPAILSIFTHGFTFSSVFAKSVQKEGSKTTGALAAVGQLLGLTSKGEEDISRLQSQEIISTLRYQLSQILEVAVKTQQKLQQKSTKLYQTQLQITQQDEKITQQDEKIAQQDEKIAQQDEKIAQQDEKIAQQDEKIAQQDEMLARADAEIRQLRSHFWLIPHEEVQDLPNKRLGEGGWGYVTEGTVKVAVKHIYPALLAPRNRDRTQREIQTMAQIRHPNLVTFVGAVFNDQHGHMIITEILDTNLRKAYEQNILGSSENKLCIFRDVANALKYLHGRPDPIIHRDVSTPNVLLKRLPNNAWRAKLSDFGSANLESLAKTLGEGALVYTAPEAFPLHSDSPNPPPPQTNKIDVYSYGVLLGEVITCQFPNPDNRTAIVDEVQHKWPAMHPLVRTCIRYDPNDRPTMAHVLSELDTQASASALTNL